MSVFQRRTRTAAGAPPEGVRAASYSAPVPLLSTGIAALDDILCGGGVLAGSVLLFVPCAETGTASPAELGAPASGGTARAAFDAPRTAPRRTQRRKQRQRRKDDVLGDLADSLGLGDVLGAAQAWDPAANAGQVKQEARKKRKRSRFWD